MSTTNQKEQLPSIARRIFEEATEESMGSTFHTIITFHLKQKFGKDPYEVLIEDPKIFYYGLMEVLGTGADAILSLVCAFMAKKCNTSCFTDEFLKLFARGDESSKCRLAEILAKAGKEILKTTSGGA